ncbi:MAG: Asp23/Gls24 family envelope stress response protein [Bombilactobacillus mellifer]|nr:Asp23/Gls24 family envelope stress response protein [Bombilactobacillus mellifer]
MGLKVNTKFGQVEISNSVIATIVGNAVADVFGVIGLAPLNNFRDNLYGLLNKKNYQKGVQIKQVKGEIEVEVAIIVGFGMKISEIGKNVQDRIRYNLELMLSVSPATVNVIVQDVKLIDD